MYSIHVYIHHVLISTGLKHEFSNNRDMATEPELADVLQTSVCSYRLLAHVEKHQTVSLFCMLSANSLTAVTFGATGFSGTDISFTACSESVWLKTARQEKKWNQCNQQHGQNQWSEKTTVPSESFTRSTVIGSPYRHCSLKGAEVLRWNKLSLLHFKIMKTYIPHTGSFYLSSVGVGTD